jgi:hypothetical protein
MCGFSAAWSVNASRAVAPNLPEAHATTPQIDQPASAPDPLDMHGFAKVLSVPPPVAAVEADPKAVAEGSRFSLLGISDGPQGLVASIHDRSDDRVHFVREGDQLGKAIVKRVAPREVEIAGTAAPGTLGTSAGGNQRIQLREPKLPSARSTGGGA